MVSSSTPTAAFQHSRHFRQGISPHPSLHGQNGLGSRLSIPVLNTFLSKENLLRLTRKVQSPDHSLHSPGSMLVNKIQNKALPLWLHSHQYHEMWHNPVHLPKPLTYMPTQMFFSVNLIPESKAVTEVTDLSTN